MKADLNRCPVCDGWTRREFLTTTGKAVLGATVFGGAAQLFVPPSAAARGPSEKAESLVKKFYNTLNDDQKKAMVLPWTDARRLEVGNNWHVVPAKIGETFNGDQKEMLRAIFKGVTNEDSWPRFQKQMKDDAGGFDNYSVAVFTDAEGKQMEWMMTGRHMTLRCDGGAEKGSAFGGPIFYGHAVTFNERPDHPGNVWWVQGRLANKVFDALDGKQRERALLDKAPPDSMETVTLRGTAEGLPGLAIGEMSADQKAHVEKVMKELLSPYRPSDVEEVMQCLKENGGLDAVRMQFYKQGDIGNDGVWDIWRLEGPRFVWFFRGSPHVHTWINVAHKA